MSRRVSLAAVAAEIDQTRHLRAMSYRLQEVGPFCDRDVCLAVLDQCCGCRYRNRALLEQPTEDEFCLSLLMK